MMTRRFDDLPEYAFPRLRALLAAHTPGADPVVDMSIGEPKHPVPKLLMETLSQFESDFSRYPPIDGTPSLREAMSSWYNRRFDCPDPVDPDHHILPVNGTREGLFMAALALASAEKNGARAAFLLPNPFYQVYAAAALAVGAEPVFVPATAENGWLPDYASLPEELLARTSFAYYCSPTNPQGAVASAEHLAMQAQVAEAYGFTIVFDEPYTEAWRDVPPPSGLASALAAGVDREHVLIFNSLSKRSSAAGLRSGFVIGGERSIAAIKRLRAYAGAPNPIPLMHAAEALWRDEAHVEASRLLYKAKLDLADEYLGTFPGYVRPDAGFFLWIGVGDGEAATIKLWEREGVKVLPGAYLGRGDPRFLGGANPGEAYIRAALVAPIDAVRPGIEAIARLLEEEGA